METMTNDQISEIYRLGAQNGHIAGLRSVWNAGWYEKAGTTLSSGLADQSTVVAKPTAVVKVTKK